MVGWLHVAAERPHRPSLQCALCDPGPMLAANQMPDSAIYSLAADPADAKDRLSYHWSAGRRAQSSGDKLDVTGKAVIGGSRVGAKIAIFTASSLIAACSPNSTAQNTPGNTTGFKYSESQDEFTRTTYTFADAYLENMQGEPDPITRAYFTCTITQNGAPSLELSLSVHDRKYIEDADINKRGWVMNNIQIRIGDNSPIDVGYDGLSRENIMKDKNEFALDVSQFSGKLSFSNNSIIMTRINAGSVGQIVDAKIDLNDPAIKKVFTDCGKRPDKPAQEPLS